MIDDPMERAYNVLGVALGEDAPKGLVARAVKAAELIAELEADAKLDGLKSAAIRAAARREAFEEAARHMDRNGRAESESAFPHTAEFAWRVAGYFRALATGKGAG